MKMILIRNGILFFFIFILYACYEQTITINQDDKTGIITYRILYSNEYDNFLSYLNEMHDIELNTSIFFEKKELEKIISKNRSTSLINYSLSNFGNGKKAEVSFSYNNFENFPTETPFLYFPIHIYEENKVVNYSTTLLFLNKSGKKDIKNIYKNLEKNEKEIIDNYLSLMKLKFIYKSFKPIINTTNGIISKDKKELVYETTIFEILNSKDEINITFSFKK